MLTTTKFNYIRFFFELSELNSKYLDIQFNFDYITTQLLFFEN